MNVGNFNLKLLQGHGVIKLCNEKFVQIH